MISPMQGPFGAIADGVDLAADGNDETMRGLIAALHEHQILAIRGQNLTDGQYVNFGRHWGKPLAFFIQSHVKEGLSRADPHIQHRLYPIARTRRGDALALGQQL